MKTTLLLAVIIFTAVNMFPQKGIFNHNPKPNKTTSPNAQIYLPDSLILYTMTDTLLVTASYDQTGATTQRLVRAWYNGGWGNYMRDIMTYIGNTDISMDLMQMWVNGQWVNSTFDSSTYDAKGNMLAHLYSYYSQGVRRDSIKSLRSYDAKGSMLTNIGWYMINGQWVNHDQSIYTNDTSGNHLTFLFQQWSGSQWTNSELWTYTYDLNGHLLTSCYQVWYGQWDNATLSTYTYDQNGNMLSFFSQSSLNGQWVNYSLDNYTYNANGKLITDWFKKWTTGAYMDAALYTYTYDTKGNMVNKLTQYWVNGVLTNFYQTVYTYDSNGNIITGNNTTWSGSSWARTDDQFVININNDDYYFTGYAINLYYILVNTTGIAADNNSILKGYSLSQNYPNPFNPSTTINYSISKSGDVVLKVFNIMGKEIETLVNEQKPSGNYTVKFDASKLTSGVYFYQLKSGNYVSTKKLVLLK
jgi:hypothetical protein